MTDASIDHQLFANFRDHYWVIAVGLADRTVSDLLEPPVASDRYIKSSRAIESIDFGHSSG